VFGRGRARRSRRPGQDSLADLRPGDLVEVVAVDGDGGQTTAHRLDALGFIPGTTVEVIRRAPLADPVIFRLQDGDVSLRAVDAARVRVRYR
jgi:ferrous iron transport protein A